jgi:solute carrier family 25 citrate transporter 1
MSGLVSSSREVAVLVVAADPAARKAHNSPAVSLIAGGSAGAIEAAATVGILISKYEY